MLHASDNWWVSGLVLMLSGILILNILIAQRGRPTQIRRIPGLNAVDDAIGRATEMGRKIMMIPGITALDVPTLQGLAILGHIAGQVAGYGSKSLTPCADPVVAGVAHDIVSDSYGRAGRSELFDDDDDVRYLTTEQFAFAAGVAGLMQREKVAASFLFGNFFAESLIIGEVGHQIDAIQIAGTPKIEQIPFLIASCDYVLIGEEFYAASAYLSRDPTALGSIRGQDWSKLLLMCTTLAGVVAASFVSFCGTHAYHPRFLHTVNEILNALKT